ncbi:type II secretion system F family protein [Orenia marismortui]|uniref:type II secretion system F family protein n=1 Tax=Orenia marismortui TaxID=46469 RepID=UPI00036C0E94|nr:type II secretion system F family protein [Orenia marismortui]
MAVIAQVFLYKARDSQGSLTEGLIEAENEEIVARRLRDRGFYITSIEKEEQEKKSSNIKLPFLNRVKLSDLALFCRQFSTMINSGLSLVKSLDILTEQTENSKLREAVGNIKEKVEGGMALSTAMKEEKKIFPKLLISMIEAAEIGGLLDSTLEEMADHFESENELSQKIKSAMAYPLIISVVAVGIVIFLIMGVLPTFVEMFENMGQQLPLITRALLGLSKFLTIHWYVVPLVIFAPIISIYLYYQRESGRKKIDAFKLKVPVFGKLLTKIAVARFTRTLGILVNSGVSILEGLDIVANIISNQVIADSIREARKSISEGESIAIPLRKNGVFPMMVLQMIKVGEETGKLDEMLLKISDFYEKEVEHTVEAAVSLIEPLMIVVMGVVVGGIVAAMMLPMFDMVQGI